MKTLSANLFLLTKSSDAFPLGIPFLNSMPFCVVRGMPSLKDLSSLLKSVSQSFFWNWRTNMFLTVSLYWYSYWIKKWLQNPVKAPFQPFMYWLNSTLKLHWPQRKGWSIRVMHRSFLCHCHILLLHLHDLSCEDLCCVCYYMHLTLETFSGGFKIT